VASEEPREQSMTAALGITCHNPKSRVCELKGRCTRAPFRKIARDINEEARDHVRALMGTPEFEQSSDERKKVEGAALVGCGHVSGLLMRHGWPVLASARTRSRTSSLTSRVTLRIAAVVHFGFNEQAEQSCLLALS
jgi:hypothetical protein